MSAGEHATPDPFSITLRVYYQHTDAGGVVYHANYLSFMEAARTELLHFHGFDLEELAERFAVMFIVHRANLSFQRPARLHDLLRVTALPEHVGRARLRFRQEVFCQDERLVSALIDLACVDLRTWRPVVVPEAVRLCMSELAMRKAGPSGSSDGEAGSLASSDVGASGVEPRQEETDSL